MKKIKVFVAWSGDAYAAGTGEINGMVVATGATTSAVKKAFKSAFAFHIKGSVADGDKLPKYILNGKYTFDYELQASAILRQLDGIVTRVALSKATGINEKLLGHYFTGRKEARPGQRNKIITGVKRIANGLSEVV